MKFTHLVGFLVAFVVTASARWILTKLTDTHKIFGFTDEQGKQLEFRHPWFQTMLSFVFEVSIFLIYALPKLFASEKKRATQMSCLTFLYPAMCDFIDSCTLNMAIT